MSNANWTEPGRQEPPGWPARGSRELGRCGTLVGMGIINYPNGGAADTPAAVHDAAAPLALLWSGSQGAAFGRISPAQLRALLVIQQHSELNLTRLADEMGVMLSSASRLCERLVAAGLLVRESARSNRREICLRLTRDGERLLDELASRRRASLAVVLDRMPARDQQALLRGLQAFARACDADRHELPSGQSGVMGE